MVVLAAGVGAGEAGVPVDLVAVTHSRRLAACSDQSFDLS
jgi:hypothetical protein